MSHRRSGVGRGHVQVLARFALASFVLTFVGQTACVLSGAMSSPPPTTPPGACAPEICGDGVDQDCSGADEPCPVCSDGAVAEAGCACGGGVYRGGFCCAAVWRHSACGTVNILWHDDIQSNASQWDDPVPWGFNGAGVEHPIGTRLDPPADASGANLSVVPDPAGGSGFALRHFGTFDQGGSRSQVGIYGMAYHNTIFEAQAESAGGIYAAQEWYFPEAIGAGNGSDVWPWLSVWDWHSTGGGGRWHTDPGVMLAEDGSMRVRFEWGPTGNPESGLSSVPLPVGRWFDVEMYWHWSSTGTTVRLWIDGVLALEQGGVVTRAPGHDTVEMYVKFYGSDQARTPWSPTPTIRYTRNVRIAADRIWQ